MPSAPQLVFAITGFAVVWQLLSRRETIMSATKTPAPVDYGTSAIVPQQLNVTNLMKEQEIQEKIANIKPYRNYDNLEIRDGRVLGGL